MHRLLDRPTGKLVLADGTRYNGYLAGAPLPRTVGGEVVFNTSMTGYQEVITDPSYAGQIVMMTYPQIGNYGVTVGDSENPGCAARALVVRELSPFYSPGPARISLEQFLREQGLVCLTGVDTRAITRRVRTRGAVAAVIGRETDRDEDLLEGLKSGRYAGGPGLVDRVSGSGLDHLAGVQPGRPVGGEDSTATRSAASCGAGARAHLEPAIPLRGRAAVVDLGVKKSIVDNLLQLGLSVDVFNSGFCADDVNRGGYDCVVLSNGPGDPQDVPDVIREVGALIGDVPLLGICLGHQVTALALGAKTYKLKFGHHGANQPVVDRRTGRVFTTSQNHNYAVDRGFAERSGVDVTYVNANDETVEGFVDDGNRLECVQFHPEAAPGPHDTAFVFSRFWARVEGWKHAATA